MLELDVAHEKDLAWQREDQMLPGIGRIIFDVRLDQKIRL